MKIGNINIKTRGLIFSLAMAGFVALLTVEFAYLPTMITPPAAHAIAQNDCTRAALADYNRSNLMLAQQDATGASQAAIGVVIARRRTQEQYCLQVARCSAVQSATQLSPLQYRFAFESCLRDEALVEYGER